MERDRSPLVVASQAEREDRVFAVAAGVCVVELFGGARREREARQAAPRGAELERLRSVGFLADHEAWGQEREQELREERAHQRHVSDRGTHSSRSSTLSRGEARAQAALAARRDLSSGSAKAQGPAKGPREGPRGAPLAIRVGPTTRSPGHALAEGKSGDRARAGCQRPRGAAERGVIASNPWSIRRRPPRANSAPAF